MQGGSQRSAASSGTAAAGSRPCKQRSGEAEPLTDAHALREHLVRAQHRGQIEQRLSHAHEHDVGDALQTRRAGASRLGWAVTQLTVNADLRGPSLQQAGSSRPALLLPLRLPLRLTCPKRSCTVSTWSTISCGSRLRAKPPLPVAQNVHRMGQPTCTGESVWQLDLSVRASLGAGGTSRDSLWAAAAAAAGEPAAPGTRHRR